MSTVTPCGVQLSVSVGLGKREKEISVGWPFDRWKWKEREPNFRTRFSGRTFPSTFGQTGWLIGWLVGWLVGWLIGWLVGWLVDLLVVWLVSWTALTATTVAASASVGGSFLDIFDDWSFLVIGLSKCVSLGGNSPTIHMLLSIVMLRWRLIALLLLVTPVVFQLFLHSSLLHYKEDPHQSSQLPRANQELQQMEQELNTF